MMTEQELTSRIDRIKEYLDYGNLLGAQDALTSLINDARAAGNLPSQGNP
jgi:hypothetical protein